MGCTSIFQSEKMAKNKSKCKYLCMHAFLHALLTYLFLGCWENFTIPMVIFITHAIIDFIKAKINKNTASFFLIDQLSHVLVILLLSIFFQGDVNNFYWINLFKDRVLRIFIFISGVILTLRTASVLIGLILDNLLKISKKNKAEKIILPTERGIRKGGEIIGYLERALIFIFILMNQPMAIGFLITAKSILRFGEIARQKSWVESEYIIIGTFLSLLCGLIGGLMTRYLINNCCALV